MTMLIAKFSAGTAQDLRIRYVLAPISFEPLSPRSKSHYFHWLPRIYSCKGMEEAISNWNLSQDCLTYPLVHVHLRVRIEIARSIQSVLD